MLLASRAQLQVSLIFHHLDMQSKLTKDYISEVTLPRCVTIMYSLFYVLMQLVASTVHFVGVCCLCVVNRVGSKTDQKSPMLGNGERKNCAGNYTCTQTHTTLTNNMRF